MALRARKLSGAFEKRAPGHLSGDTSPSMIVFALYSVKAEHNIRIRDLLSEAERNNKLASGAVVLAFVLASLRLTSGL